MPPAIDPRAHFGENRLSQIGQIPRVLFFVGKLIPAMQNLKKSQISHKFIVNIFTILFGFSTTLILNLS